MFFRKFLVRLRKEYNGGRTRLYVFSGLATVLFVGVGLVADWLMPFSGWANALRSLILVPTSVSMFVLFYAVGLFLHYARERANPEWVPYRLRVSPSWRRRISAIVGAVMIVLVYANGFRIGYTAVSSLFVALVIVLFAFMRTTKDEAAREQLNIPDSRDLKYEQQMAKLAERRAEREKKKAREKAAKRRKLLGQDEEKE